MDILGELQYRYQNIQRSVDGTYERYYLYKWGLEYIIWVREELSITVRGNLCGKWVVIHRKFPLEDDIAAQIIRLIDNATKEKKDTNKASSRGSFS